MARALPPEHRFQKLCTLRTHEPHYSSEDVLFNHDRFPGPVWIGDLAQIIPIKPGVTSRDFVKPEGVEVDGYTTRMLMDEDGILLGPSNLSIENWRAYTFVVRDAPPEIKDKDQNLKVCPLATSAGSKAEKLMDSKISISSAIAAVFGFKSGMKVVVQLVSGPIEPLRRCCS